MRYADIQKEEARTWLMPDEKVRKEKAMREWIRYPWIKKCMGLDTLDTTDMVVFDIGAGPLDGVSSVLNCKAAFRLDPLADEYKKYFVCTNYRAVQAEKIEKELGKADLIIVTNAMDHFEDPTKFLYDLNKYCKPSCYFAHFHAINNAVTHPHGAHEHNINPEIVKGILNSDWEMCWNMDYQHDGLTYAWLKQPAFAQLWRKVTGYGK